MAAGDVSSLHSQQTPLEPLGCGFQKIRGIADSWQIYSGDGMRLASDESQKYQLDTAVVFTETL